MLILKTKLLFRKVIPIFKVLVSLYTADFWVLTSLNIAQTSVKIFCFWPVIFIHVFGHISLFNMLPVYIFSLIFPLII